MKNKNKIFLFVAMFLLSVFFASPNLVSAQSTYSECINKYSGTASDCAGYPGDPNSGSESQSSSCNTGNESSACCQSFGGFWYGNPATCNDSPDYSNQNSCYTGNESSACCQSFGGFWYGNPATCNSDPEPTAVVCPSGTIIDFMTKTCIKEQVQVQYTYSECIDDGGDKAYCGGFPGAPTTAQSLNQASAGTCKFNSDCGANFTCYQQSCMDDETYESNVPWYSRAGNATTQVFSPGGSVFSNYDENTGTRTSDGGVNNARPVATTTVPITTKNGTVAPAGTTVMSDGSGRNAQGEEIAPPGTFQVPTNPSGNLVMCATGALSSVCRNEYGDEVAGFPVVLGTNNRNNVPVSGDPNFVGPPAPGQVVCGVGFEKVAGVCFPTQTGLADPQGGIGQIVSNLFSWLMGLFTIFAIMAFVISGIQYFMASGDEGMAETAKNNAKNALIGIVVGLSGFILLKAISAALTGQSYFF